MQSSAPLLPEDIFLIQVFIVEAASSSLAYGIYVVFAGLTAHLLLKSKSSHSKPWKVLFTLMIVIFLLLTLAEVALIVDANNMHFVSSNQSDKAKKQELSTLFLSCDSFSGLIYIISDSIVVWRAWILFSSQRTVKIFLSVCMIATCGAILQEMIITNVVGKGNTPPITNAIYVILPLFTNVAATVLIGYKTWQYYADIKKNLDTAITRKSQVEKILVLLVESGMIYCVLWGIQIIGIFEVFNLPYQGYTASLPMLAGLYPVLIILISTLEASKGCSNEMSLSQSVRFASALPASLDSETQSTGSGI